jgi:cell division protein FtsI (penicillin-binding protein 3)
MLATSGVSIGSQITMPSVERGPILDRNGRILAIQTQLNSVSAWIPNLTSPETAAALLADALGLAKDKIFEKLKTNSGFVFIKRKISPTESEKVAKLISEGKLEGISMQPEFGRNYPGKSLASHLVGYVGTDNIGLDGLEYTFNQELSPPIVGENVDMIYGNQVFLSIDISVQYAIEKIAEDTLKTSKADSIMIMVMEAKTGDILGYASLPNYDPNSFSTLTPATMRNKPITLLYEPGSVFKVFSMATLLEMGQLTPEDRFFCNGHY